MHKENEILITIIAAVLIIALLLFLGCTNTTTETNVSVRLPIPVVEAGQTPFYVANDLGFYEVEGLNVIFNLGSQELNPVSMVTLGTDDFGVLGGPDTLVVARDKDKPLKAIAVLHENSNFPVILTLKDSGIETLKDLDEKKVGFFYGHISTDILRALFNKESIAVQEVDVGFDYSQLLSKSIDAQWAFRQTAGITLPSKGVKLNVIQPADYGINSHGYTIFVREEFITKNPEIIEKFLRATLKGVRYSAKHPEKSIDILLKYDSKLDKDTELQRLAVYNLATSTKPYGKMTYDMFDETMQRLLDEKVISKSIDAKDLFDNSFVKNIQVAN
jgi:NitT/TauT family transport system substrate-binding protein